MQADHELPIIEKPWLYSIAEFRYHVGLDGSEPYIDLTLQRDSVTRRLRFRFPQNLQIEEGCFPAPTGGMKILDVRKGQLDGIGVHVSDFEGTRGAITFWAREVADLDSMEAG